MSRSIILLATLLLLCSNALLAQSGSATASTTDVAFWVDHWSRPPVNLFGPDEEAFNQNMQGILFPWNDHEEPSNPDTLESNVRWLKDHPNMRFYIDGYASSRGEDIIYNLRLAQRRAEWVKQALLSRGIPEDRIRIAAGWGQLYPLCPELNDECWSKNRIVRFVYAPN